MTTTLIIRTGLPRYDDDLKAFVLIQLQSKGPGSVYDKWNISVVICDRDIP